LAAAGFAVERHSLSDVGPGTIVRHGSSGGSAASLVIATMGRLLPDSELMEPVSVLEVDHLKGRTVQLTVGPPLADSGSSTSLGNIASSVDADTKVPPTSTLGNGSSIATGSQSEGGRSDDSSCR